MRHACEVLVNDVGVEAIEKRVVNPLTGLKVAGYVGCQTVRPFAGTAAGGDYDAYDDPHFLDDFAGAWAPRPSPRAQDRVLRRLGGGDEPRADAAPDEEHPRRGPSAAERHLDALPVVPDQRRNVPAGDQREIRHEFQIPVVFYSQLMAVAFGMDGVKDAALQRNTIRAEKLEAMAKSAKS